MPDFLGTKHWLGARPQTAAGVPEATVNTFLHTSKIQMDAGTELIERTATLGTGYALPSLPGWQHPSASCTCEVHASVPQPWYWALGAVNTTSPGPTARLHAITEADAPVRLTLEANKVYQRDRQADAYVSELQFTFKAQEIAGLDLSFLALSHAADVVTTSVPVFTNLDPLVCSRASVSIGGAKDYTVEGGSVSYNGALDAAFGLTDQTERQALKIRRSGVPEITASLDFLDFPKTYLDDMMAAQSFALVIELLGAIIETTHRRLHRVTLPCCQFTGGLDAEIGEGLITGSAEIKAYYDPVTGRRILVESQNTVASIIT